MINIVLIGPPGSGKGTQAEILRDTYDFLKISAGDELRREVAAKSEIGVVAKAFIDKGELVPDEVIVKVIRETIANNHRARSIVFDGFPRSLGQAREMDQMFLEINRSVDFAVVLEVKDEEIATRLSSRYNCIKCNASYNKVSKNPRIEGVCDNCGSTEFFQREDDKYDTILARLKTFREQTLPLVEYYDKKGILRKINGMKDIKEVANDIAALLKQVAKAASASA